MRRWCLVLCIAAATAGAVELPRPAFANSFCLFPINERFHLRAPGDRERLVAWVGEMRAVLGPARLYAPLGVAIISEGEEWELFEFCRRQGVQLVLQGGAIEHHAVAWGFPRLLRDPAQGDRRFAQWFQDGLIADPGKEDQHDFGYRACASVYAKPVQALRRAADLPRSARIAASMKRYPDVVVGCSGPIECEMHQGDDRWGDYSPFTLAEFRDYLTHRGIYAAGAARAGEGWPGGQVFADDPSPDRAVGGNVTFNATFGTRFASWSLRYWDPEVYPERLPLDAPGLPQPGARGFLAGGFDAPRVWPGRPPLAGLAAEGNERLWEAWASTDDARPGFRAKLLSWWVGDHTRMLAEAGVPRERIFSHQIPGESYGLGRLSQGASMVQTAHTPSGSIGITTYFGAASDVEVFTKLTALDANWGIFEYHPHPIGALTAPVSEYLHSMWTCVRFRAHVLTPIDWTSDDKDFVVRRGPFAQAMAQVLAALPDQPYYDRAPVAYTPPAVAGVQAERLAGNQAKITWSPLLWPDLKHVWTDWRDFDQFEVRAADGRVLGRTREASLTVPGDGQGLRVVATRRPPVAIDQ
ncbi:MAG: hypothetical protein HZB16_01665 [Armatimonadetes bacterium]|nr:hypothetical protein [Armatimonadota bacterium]